MSLNSSSNPGSSQWSPISEAILRELGASQYLDTPPLKLLILVNKIVQPQAANFMSRTTLAHDRFLEMRPVVVRPRAIEQRFVDVEAIHRAAIIERENADNTGLNLVVLLCKVEPVDLVLGVDEQGQALVTDLRRAVAKMYPDQTQKFVTQTELKQAARGRFFAGEPDAFLLVAIERLYRVQLTTRSSGA